MERVSLNEQKQIIGGKTYRCICGKKFTKKASYIAHLIIMHGGWEKYI